MGGFSIDYIAARADGEVYRIAEQRIHRFKI